MTIPTTYQRSVTSGGPTRIGGNAINCTQTADNPLTVAMILKDRVPNGIRRRVVVVASTGGAYEVGTALTAGTLGYDAPANEWISPFTTDSVNGTADTSLLNTGSDNGQDRKHVKEVGSQKGAQTMTAWREAAWQPIGITAQRSNWDSAAASVTSGRLSTLTGENIVGTTHASNDSVDRARGDITVPGRLIYRDGSPDVVVATYPVFTGP